MNIREWLNKRRDAILKDWKENKLSYGDAAAKLMHQCEMSVDQACRLLEKT